MQETTPAVVNDEKAVEHPEWDGWDREEIHGRNGFPMITQKGEPTFSRFRISRRSPHPPGDGSLGDVETKHQELVVNTWCAPDWVFGYYPENQIANFLRDSLPAAYSGRFGDGKPVEATCSFQPNEFPVGQTASSVMTISTTASKTSSFSATGQEEPGPPPGPRGNRLGLDRVAYVCFLESLLQTQ